MDLMIVKKIEYLAVGILVGLVVGVFVSAPVKNLLSGDAYAPGGSTSNTSAKPGVCQFPKLWTGNGCADTRKWSDEQWELYNACMKIAFGPPDHPSPEDCAKMAELAKFNTVIKVPKGSGS